MPGYFEVDRKGLKALVADRPKSFIVRELVQNAWDEPNVTMTDINLEQIPGTRKARLTVEDDAPEGYHDIRHAYTLFADTRKRTDPSKRGRFNLGEKQVLALCESAEIITTTSAIRFKADGTRTFMRGTRRKAGSIFSAVIPMTKKEFEEISQAVQSFLPPEQIATVFNGEQIQYRAPTGVFIATLQTEFADAEGVIRPSQRKTTVEVHEPLEGETPTLYEMGLPVVGTGDRWHYNVNQRVPLSTDRDNVKPSYLRDLRAEFLNHMADELAPDDFSEAWVLDALEDDRIEAETAKTVVKAQHGHKAFIRDPNDPDATERAMALGWTPVSSRAYSKQAWKNIRKAEGALPVSTSLSGVGRTITVDAELVTVSEWTEGMERVARLTKFIAWSCLHLKVDVGMVKSPDATTSAQYGNRTLRFNISNLGRKWFKRTCSENQIDLIVHELGHEGGGHLEMGYHNMLTRIAAHLGLMNPDDLVTAARG